MKKSLLLLSIFVFGVGIALAQEYQIKESVPTIKAWSVQKGMLAKGFEKPSHTASAAQDINKSHQRSPENVTVINLGNAANAYSYIGNQRTILWVDDTLNTIAHFHRMTSNSRYSGDLAMDISMDGGESFENNVMIYESTMSGESYNLDAIRYPQGVIYNPEGNKDPTNAKAIYFGPNLDGSNGNWGGYSYGHASLNDFTNTSKNLKSSTSGQGIYQFIPNAMTIQSNGQYWVVEPSMQNVAGNYQYTGNLLINKGAYSESEGDVTLEQNLLPANVTSNENGAVLSDHKIAFGPDGQVGYIAILGNDGSIPFSEECLYPIIFKTTDGGESWQTKGGIQLGGAEGVPSIVYELLTDEQISELYDEPLPERDRIPYTTAFDFDMVVDSEGNLHIAAVVGVSPGSFSVVPGDDLMSAMDIFTLDGGDTWNAVECRGIKLFRGEFGSEADNNLIHADNRIQASVTKDGENVFISWLDSNPEKTDENNKPDIWTCGVDVKNETYTDPVKVTEFTEAWRQAYFAIAPHYVFDNGDNYEIPFTYQEMNPADPVEPVQYKYIKGFTLSDEDFVNEVPDMSIAVETIDELKAKISQNAPNPFSTTSTVELRLDKRAKISLEVINMVGQTVYRIDKGEMLPGKKQFTIDASGLKPGAYFYRISVGKKKVTKKMIVE